MMFAVWGKKTVYRKLGYVADFCLICREPTPFRLRRIGQARHVCRIGLGPGELVGYERTCEKCGTSYRRGQVAYRAVSKRLASVTSLQRKTFPNLAQVWQERLALEEQVRRAAWQIPAPERATLIRDPFLVLAPRVEKYFQATHVDRPVMLALIAAVALAVGGPELARLLAPDLQELVFLASLPLGVVLVLWQLAGSGRRHLRREIIPVLVKALRPLRPTQAELAPVLAELRQLKRKIGTKVSPSELKAHLPSLR